MSTTDGVRNAAASQWSIVHFRFFRGAGTTVTLRSDTVFTVSTFDPSCRNKKRGREWFPSPFRVYFFNSDEADTSVSMNDFVSFCVTKILIAWFTFVTNPSGAADPCVKLGTSSAVLKS